MDPSMFSRGWPAVAPPFKMLCNSGDNGSIKGAAPPSSSLHDPPPSVHVVVVNVQMMLRRGGVGIDRFAGAVVVIARY